MTGKDCAACKKLLELGSDDFTRTLLWLLTQRLIIAEEAVGFLGDLITERGDLIEKEVASLVLSELEEADVPKTDTGRMVNQVVHWVAECFEEEGRAL